MSMVRAGIIGAGNIGWRYDGGVWDGRRSVSHAACIARHPRCTLVAVGDPDAQAREHARQAFSDEVLVTGDLDAFFCQDLDLVCIASPTSHHGTHLRACLEHETDYVLLEKPVATDFTEYEQLVDLWTAHQSTRVLVNYFRRSLPQVAKLRDACRSSELVALDFSYSRGLAVNGVHLLDLMGDLLDTNSAPPLTWASGSVDNPSFGLTSRGVDVTVRGFDLPYHCIEVRAIFPDGRLSLLDGGARLEYEQREENPDYPGFFHLAPPGPAVDPIQATSAMRDGTYLSLCNLLDDRVPVNSSLATAGFAQELLSSVEQGCAT